MAINRVHRIDGRRRHRSDQREGHRTRPLPLSAATAVRPITCPYVTGPPHSSESILEPVNLHDMLEQQCNRMVLSINYRTISFPSVIWRCARVNSELVI